jgi:hypothetical protein
MGLVYVKLCWHYTWQQSFLTTWQLVISNWTFVMDESFLDWSIVWDLLCRLSVSWDIQPGLCMIVVKLYKRQQTWTKSTIDLLWLQALAQNLFLCNIASQLIMFNLTSHPQHGSGLYHATEPCLWHQKTITTAVAETEFRFLFWRKRI